MRGFFCKFFCFSLAFIIVIISASTLFAAQFAADSSETKNHMQSWGFEHKEGIVLVLCGGGMKGIAHIGVLDAFEKENIPIAAIVGTSMGSIMGGLYASGMTIDEMREKALGSNLIQIMSGRVFGSAEFSLNTAPSPNSAALNVAADENKNIKTGLALVNTKDLYSFMTYLASGVTVTDFDEMPIPFAAIAVDLISGHAVRLRNGSLASAMRASMSIPVIFEPWPVDDMLLVDGGLKANLPVCEAKKMFPGHPVVAINLSSAETAISKDEIRSIVDVAKRSIEIIMADQITINKAEADLVITPELSGFSTFSEKGYDEIVERGRIAAEQNMPAVKALIAEKCCVYDHTAGNSGIKRASAPLVREIIFRGLSDKIAANLRERYISWCNKPYNAEKIAEAVSEISRRDDIISIESHAEQCGRNLVDIVFIAKTPEKYEFEINGYSSNITPDRWLSATVIARNILMQGDTASIEGRLSKNWGVDLRYFTPKDKNLSQFGIVLGARNEAYSQVGFFGSERYISDWEFDRYTAKAAWYREFGRHIRVGAGYAFSHTTKEKTYNILADDDVHGPYFSFSYSNLDDPVMPTTGVSLQSDVWIPVNHRNMLSFGARRNVVISDTQFSAYMPVFDRKAKLVFKGGYITGDWYTLGYNAMLGIHGNFYSRSRHPVFGDMAYWVHLGIEKEFIRSWWGGVNVELFGNYGGAHYSSYGGLPSGSQEIWEAGIAFSAPVKNFLGKLIFLYDRDNGFTVGYSVGIPNFKRGPMP